MSIKLIIIGDPHIKINNIPDVDLFINKLEQLCLKELPDLIICLGDVLDTHERIHVTPLNKAYELFDRLRKIAKTYVLVGNHDYASNTEFLSENHWMNALKEWNNLHIIDKTTIYTIDSFTFTFVPYVFAGRFQEALDTKGGNINIKNWIDSTCIFAHQEFFGCKMGAIISSDGDKWPEHYPHIISGHIHSRQKIQSNIYYTGSAMQNAFGESEKNIIALVTFEKDKKDYTLDEIDLGLPRKKIVRIDIDNIDDYIDKYELKEDNTNEEGESKKDEYKDKIKLNITGVYDQFKSFKKTTKYKKMIESGIKITFKPKIIDPPNPFQLLGEDENGEIKSDITNFELVLRQLIDKQKNKLVGDTLNLILLS